MLPHLTCPQLGPPAERGAGTQRVGGAGAVQPSVHPAQVRILINN